MTPLPATEAPPGLLYMEVIDRKAGCGNLLQMNCAMGAEEWPLLLHRDPLFPWYVAECLFTDRELLVAELGTSAAGGVVPTPVHN